ncbi:MAG TPA: polysaccharide biosynthesis C-terminal domain-containing protein [Burkholderiaceae bacterium]|nr:polysaccharide biosynthesis C-terminal domain-containing protein [Burkholderiaceae bacterium]
MLRHAALYLLFRGANGLVALLSLYALTRLLSPESYGRYALGMASINAVAVLGFQWLNVSMGRFHGSDSGEPNAQRLAAAHHAWAGLSLAALALLPLLGALGLVRSLDALDLLLAAAGGAVLALHGLHLQLFNAEQQPGRYGWLGVARASLALAGCLLGVYTVGTAAAGLAGLAAGSLLSLLWLGHRPGLRGLFSAPARSLPAMAALARFGLPLSLTYLSIVLLDVTDRFLIDHWHGSAALAPYGAAFDLCQQTMAAVLNVLYLASYPRIVKAWESEGAAAARQATAPLQRGMLLLAPWLVLVFSSAAPEITALLLGPDLREPAARLLPWIALAVLFSTLRAFLLDVALHLQKATRLHVLTTALMALGNLGLNLLLVPRHGAWGAALASACAFAIGMVASLWFGRRAGIFEGLGAQLLRVLLCTGLTGLVLLQAGERLPAMAPWLGLALKIGLSGLCYSALAWAAGLLRGWPRRSPAR